MLRHRFFCIHMRGGSMMKVSFDLDETLFIDPNEIPAEDKLKFPYYLFYKERLRRGTIALIRRLQEEGIKVWIYTTSFRSETYIRRLFKCYGLSLDEVINGKRHKEEVQAAKNEPMPSKYPSRYRIDLHIDDETSVAQNGKLYGFNVYIIKRNDPNWCNNIIHKVNMIKTRELLH